MSEHFTREVYYDFFSSPNSHEWIRRTVPAIMELYNYDKSLYEDKRLRATILAEITQHLPIPDFKSLTELLYEDKETALFVREQIKLRTRWWFKEFVPYSEYLKLKQTTSEDLSDLTRLETLATQVAVEASKLRKFTLNRYKK